MTKEQFLKQLDIALKRLPTEERQDILRDYEEHFTIGIEEGKTEEKSFDKNITAIKVNTKDVGVNVLPIKEQTVKVEFAGNESLYVDSNNGFVRIESLNIKDVKTKTANGLADLKSITATEVNVETNNGQITFDDVEGKVSGKTQNGQITFAAKSIDQPIQLETEVGRILLQTKQAPTNVKFDVYTGSGTINILDAYTGSTVIGNGENLIFGLYT